MERKDEENGPSVFTFATALAVVLSLSFRRMRKRADLYKSKCAMCHGADGMKAAGHDLSRQPTCKKIGCRSYGGHHGRQGSQDAQVRGQVEAGRD
jgi:hypothetical protein